MTTLRPPRDFVRAFTLIELLVVIAIIGALAAMLLPVGTAVMRNSRIKHSQAQMNQIITWLESYKEKRGQYPPDNPGNSALPPLVYELTGTQFIPAQDQYLTKRSSTPLGRLTVVKPVFGIDGFANASLPGAGDDSPKAENFARSMDQKNYATTTNGLEILVSPYERPTGAAYPPVFDPSIPKPLNPWNYVVTNPANNKTSYDLWVDLIMGAKTYRVCNWSQKTIVF